MLDYNGNTYVRPYGGYSQPLKKYDNYIMQQSTASISSNQSDSGCSVSKYSFKTGKLKNVYATKQTKETYPTLLNRNSLHQLYHHFGNPNRTQMKRLQQPNIYQTQNQKSLLLNRSQSCNFTAKHYKPIPDPPIKQFVQYRHHENKVNKQSVLKNQRKRQLEQENYILKKSISEKKFVYERKFSELTSKVNFLRSQFTKQQSKMQKITSVIKQYFG